MNLFKYLSLLTDVSLVKQVIPNLGVGRSNFIPRPFWFSHSETVKVFRDFAVFSNFLLETFVPSLISLTCSSL